MLTLLGGGSRRQFCDGVSRRQLLQIGGSALAGLFVTDPMVLAAEAKTRMSHKALIHIFLGGGPPHQDMWEIKVDAPKEKRGPLQAIQTSVPGVQISEAFPGIAKRMDKFLPVRAVIGSVNRHEPYLLHTGWQRSKLASQGGMPCVGSATSQLLGPVDRAVPPFVGLGKVGVWKSPGMPGFLGNAQAPFKPDGPGMANMKLNFHPDRLEGRRQLLTQIDPELRQLYDIGGDALALTTFRQKAFDVLKAPSLVNALDLSKVDAKTLERYGTGQPYQFQYDGSPTNNLNVLRALRLVKAGVRVVTMTYGRWDSHGKNFDLVKDHGGKLDQCLSALVDDLEAEGLLDQVTIMVWGEFGRTPIINKNAGRDHWPQVSCALLAGGGLKTGQAVGETTKDGGEALSGAIHVQSLVALLYHQLGINPKTTTITDKAGRPQYLTERELPSALI